MFPANDSTRDLLPPIATDPEDILGPEMPFAGNLVPASDVPPPSYPASHADAGLPRIEQEDGAHEHESDWSLVKVPFKYLAPSSATSNSSGAHVKDSAGSHFIPDSVAHHASMRKPSTINDRGGAGSHNPEGKQDRLPEPDGDDVHGDVSGNPDDSYGGLAETDEAHSINVRQIAIVDQDASILANGYVGEVVARVHIDQDLLMDQNVDIDLTIDGNGHFNILLDQDVRIDQDVQIDLEIFDVNGVLYVDLFLHDAVEVEQHTTVDMRISDGPFGGTVEVNQDIEMTQDVDIDIDIEDDLEERYIVKVQVDTLQQADVDQDVVVDVKECNGETEMDIYATQMAAVDQQTIVQADFALI
jgi:hypothetical protein